MFVVTVKFEIAKQHIKSFIETMQIQAHDSLTKEENCLQFDICRKADKPQEVFLYEVYRQEQDFQAHLESDHFAHFSKTVASWVESKIVETYQQLDVTE